MSEFEVGAVVEYTSEARRFAGERYILCGRDPDRVWRGLGSSGADTRMGETGWLARTTRLIAPAPKPGMRWESATKDPVKIVDMGYGMLAVEPIDPRDIIAAEWCHGTVVQIARWLYDNGYKPVEERREVRSVKGVAGYVSYPNSTINNLQNATILDARGNLGHVWRDGAMWTITWSDKSGKCWHATHFAEAICDAIARGVWNRIEVPAKESTVKCSGIAEALSKLSDDDKQALLAPYPVPTIWQQCDRLAELFGITRYPNLTAARPFADVVAGIFTTPSREQSRRYVDMAVAAIKGEPFWRATQAVLVAATPEKHSPLTPAEIVGYVNGCRAWERRRGEVAPGQRELKRWQLIECSKAASSSGPLTRTSKPFLVYERARSL